MECAPGVHNPTELGIRMAMWEARDLEGLLTRIEAAQVLRAQQPRRRSSRKGVDEAARARQARAKRMVAEGAYRKSLNSLTGQVATFTPDEERKWADKLPPKSDAPSGALSPPSSRTVAVSCASCFR